MGYRGASPHHDCTTWRATCCLHSPGHEPVAALHTCQLPSPHGRRAAGRAGGCASGGLHVFWAVACGAGSGCRGAREAKTATQEKGGVVGTGMRFGPCKGTGTTRFSKPKSRTESGFEIGFVQGLQLVAHACYRASTARQTRQSVMTAACAPPLATLACCCLATRAHCSAGYHLSGIVTVYTLLTYTVRYTPQHTLLDRQADHILFIRQCHFSGPSSPSAWSATDCSAAPSAARHTSPSRPRPGSP